MKKNLSASFKAFLPLAVAITLLSGLIFAVVQQNYRMSANDPQIQYTEKVSEFLSSGEATPEEIIGSQKIDIEKSLDTFVIIFDADKKITAMGVKDSADIPAPPARVFDWKNKKNILLRLIKGKDQNRFTWQPKKGVRVASVLGSYEKDGKIAGYVMAGRSLKEVEKRIQTTGIIILVGWFVTLLAVFATTYLTIAWRQKKPDKK